MRGLSPRVRGNRETRPGMSWIPRSIPACAGEPRFQIGLVIPCKVYPRVCGGTYEREIPYPPLRGLSPRVRGNLFALSGNRQACRSIPACAGEPGFHPVSEAEGMVYPRVCGGTAPGLRLRHRPCGLSPRVRGNPPSTSRCHICTRSIPACAGEPCLTSPSRDVSEVYPRVCGGTHHRSSFVLRRSGLSPRVRGNLTANQRGPESDGSIPACAGEPLLISSAYPLPSVYPRVCGGTIHSAQQPDSLSGLSPRVRGNPIPCWPRVAGLRSIPACAGEPDSVLEAQIRAAVYPRVCGGTGFSAVSEVSACGLSPRVRGNHEPFRYSHWWVRSIPACAGEPR